MNSHRLTCGCVETNGKWSSICEEHSNINLQLEADRQRIAELEADRTERIKFANLAAREHQKTERERDEAREAIRCIQRLATRYKERPLGNADDPESWERLDALLRMIHGGYVHAALGGEAR